jgi:signal transduction histidine kinase/ligand-binding sensor domain-containing protein/DNA-binding response OmpR family regulator
MKTVQPTSLILLLALFSLSSRSYAQYQSLKFKHLTEQQGLSQNFVWSIHQDSEGFMWFGTLGGGLNKYDGYTFTVFQHDPNDPENTLRSNVVTDIHEDRKKRLWVATFDGLHQIDKRTHKVTHYGIMSAKSDDWNSFSSIYEDREGKLWACGFGGLARFDPDIEQFTLYPSPGEFPVINSVAEDAMHRFWAGGTGGLYLLNRSSGAFTSVVIDSSNTDPFWCTVLYLDKEGMLWVGTDVPPGNTGRGLYRMDTKTSSTHFTHYNLKKLSSEKIAWNGLYQDAEGRMWICGSEGLYLIDQQTNQVINFQSNPLVFTAGTLSHQYAAAVYQDQSGAFWIGTVNGIIKSTASTKKFQSHQIIPTPPSVIRDENKITTLLTDHTSKIWLGNTTSDFYIDSHHGLYQYDPKTEKFKHFPANPSNPDSLFSNQIWSLLEDQKKQLWVVTAEALHQFNPTSESFTRYPSEIALEFIDEDPFGKLWVGGKRGIASFDPDKGQFKYYKYDSGDTTGLPSFFTYDMMATRTGDIWVATANGVARLNQQTDVFTHYLPSSFSPPGRLNDNLISTLHEDAQGNIWLGADKGGLYRLDTQTYTFTNFTMREGLPSNIIRSIINDAKGNLWIGTPKGISRFNPLTNKFRNYDISDGLPANEFLPASVYSYENELMFGSVNGFVIFHPDSIKDNMTKPPIYITGFNVFEQSRQIPTGAIELSYHENFLSFDFVALNYDAPEKNQYAYQLEGIDKDWVYSGTRRFASYTDLDPGNYTFRVKASNNDGVWNEVGASLQLRILPPWWQTWWAYTLYGLLALGLILSLRKYEMKRFKLQQQATHLADLDHLKSRFFANISHEFRTPLTLILGPLDKFIQQSENDSSAHSIYRMMQRNARRLLRLVNQLLDLSKLESGNMKLDTKPQPMVPFLKSIALSFASLAERRQIDYHFRFPGGNPVVYYDADKLEKIVSNLLSNAFKFTPDGGSVTVGIKLQDGTQKKGRQLLELKVQDSGPGIPAELIERIFDRFYQAEPLLVDEQLGSGIGLSLVRELVDLHQGKLRVENTPKSGACFTITLPVNMANYEEISLNEATAPPSLSSNEPETDESQVGQDNPSEQDQSKPLVLVVEDNADVRSFIRETLQPQYYLEEASNGMQGLQLALETIPDLIVSDVMMPSMDMPEMDGVTLCQKLKTDERTSHIPVILLTAKASGGDKITGLETGADDYMIKPFQSQELIVRIHNLIETRRRLRERYSQEITLQPTSLNINSIDQQFLERVMQIVEDHLSDTSFGVEAFSQEIGMSRGQLFRKLKALTDQSPGDIICHMRLQRAAELLVKRAGNITDVAYLTGFSDPSYFTKAFKKQFGKTPSEYMGSTVS